MEKYPSLCSALCLDNLLYNINPSVQTLQNIFTDLNYLVVCIVCRFLVLRQECQLI